MSHTITRFEYEKLIRMHAEKRRMSTGTRTADGLLRSHNVERRSWNPSALAAASNKGRGYVSAYK